MSINYEQYVSEQNSALAGAALQRLEAHRDSLSFGPHFRIATSKGLELVLPTVSYTVKDDYRPRYGTQDTKNWDILALDLDGRLLGHRNTIIFQGLSAVPGQKQLQRDFVEASGDVVTFVRGSGATIPIELVHQQLLQYEANEREDTVFYSIERNFRAVERKIDPSNTELLQQLEIEETRWQAVYGEGGLLFLDGRKLITKRQEAAMRDYVDVEAAIEGRLIRYDFENPDGVKRLMGYVEDYSYPFSVEEAQDYKKRYFEEKILPELRRLAAQS